MCQKSVPWNSIIKCFKNLYGFIIALNKVFNNVIKIRLMTNLIALKDYTAWSDDTNDLIRTIKTFQKVTNKRAI